MDEYLAWLNDYKWLNVIFLSLTIVSIVVSIYLYRKSRIRKIPVFAKRSINVISDSIKKLENITINFKNREIDNLTVTKVAFWNNGNDTINGTDQALADVLRISLSENYEVLESDVIFESSSTNNFKVKNSMNEILITFDYIDPNQGCIIKILHTGKKSSDVQLKGTFKGSNKLKQMNSNIYIIIGTSLLSLLPFLNKYDFAKERKIINIIFPWIVIFTGIGFGSAFFLLNSNDSDKLFFLIVGIIYFLSGVFILFSKSSLPKGFEVFYDDE